MGGPKVTWGTSLMVTMWPLTYPFPLPPILRCAQSLTQYATPVSVQ